MLGAPSRHAFGVARRGSRVAVAGPDPGPSPAHGAQLQSRESVSGIPVASPCVYLCQGRVVHAMDTVPGPTARSLVWNGRDGAGREVPSGIYWIRVTSGARTWNRSVIRLR